MKENIKINLVLVRTSTKISGAEIYNLYFASEIAKHNEISVSVVSNNGDFINRLRQAHIHCKKVRLIKEVGTKKELLEALFLAPFVIPLSIIGIYSSIKKNQKNIVIMESMGEKLFLTCIFKLLNVYVIWIEHGPIYITQRSEIVKFGHRHISKFTDGVIAVSSDTKSDLVSGGIIKSKVHCIYIGIDTKSIKKKVRKRSDKLKIVFLGTVGQEKGILRFIDTAFELLKYNRNFEFLVIGDGPLLNESKKIVQEKKMHKKFNFTGHVSNSLKYLVDSDILLLPTSHYEGISLAILESMSVGLIVVTKDIGGNKEIVKNNVTGVLYKEFNKKQIARKIIKIVNDNQLRRRLITGAQIKVKKDFDIQNNIKSFVTLFRSL